MKHRSKRLLSILLTLALVLGLMPGMSLTAYADNTSGTVGTASYTIDENGVLTVGGGSFTLAQWQTTFAGNANSGTSSVQPKTDSLAATTITKVVFSGGATLTTAPRYMFYRWDQLKEIDLNGLTIDSSVQSYSYMFSDGGYSGSKLEKISFGSFNTSHALYMNSMFEGLRTLTSLDLGAFKTSNVQEMKGVFSNCIALQTLDLSSFDTANVTTMSNMFYACSKLKTIVVGSGWNTDKVTNSSYMFLNCIALVGGKGTKMSDVGNKDDKTYAKVDGGAENRGYLTAAHQHGFTYQADGATITATCTAEGNCTLPGKTATLTIVAPTLTTEGETGTGISAEATITDENNIRGDATVSYYAADANGNRTGDALSAAPTATGKYRAEITLGTGENTATAHVVYTIAAATSLVTKVELNQTSIQLAVGGTETLTPSFTPANADNQTVTWSIEPSGVATVTNEGVVTGVAAGSATITVTATNGTEDTNDDVTATCGVTVGNYVAEVVNGSKYETLQAAITAAQAGDTVKLLADIVTSGTIYISNKQDLTLDLNGYGIIGNNVVARAVVEIYGTDSSNKAIVNLNDSNTSRTGGNNRPEGVTGGYITGGSAGGLSANAHSILTMNGGTITGNSTSVLGGGVSNSGTFIMNGGAITNNRSESRGGGVSNSGTFTMNAGTITGNTAGTDGGGVYHGGSSLNINGGTITGNSADSLGGGVYVSGTNFKLSGGPVIKDNKVGTANSNVYLDKWVSGSNSYQRIITISASLRNTDPIGIAMATPGVFTSGLKNNGDASNFTSDDRSYKVTLDGNGNAKLVGHVHDFNYALATVTTANDSIKATCGNTDGLCALTSPVTLTLTPTTKTAYDVDPQQGAINIVSPSEWQATLTGLADFNDATALGIQQSDVKYYNTENGAKTGEASSTPFYMAGTYCAEITASGKTASIIYTIERPKYQGMPTKVLGNVTDTTVRIKEPEQSGETYEYKLGDRAWTTTPTFEGLNPHTQYAISARMKEHPDDTVVTGTATTYYTTAITGTAKVGQTLTASVTDLTPESDYDFKWFVGQTDTPSYGKTYTIQAADVGKQAKLVVVRKETNSVVGEALSDPIAAKDTLTAADFTYTAPEGTTNGLVEYNGSPKAATVTSTKDGVSEITVEYWYSEEAFTITAPTDHGIYTVKISIPETDNYSKVEHFTADGWQFTITKADSAVTAPPTAKTLTENGQNQELVNAGSATGGNMQYALGTDATTAPTDGWGTSIPTATNAGTYYVWYKVVGDANHKNTEPVCVTVTISAAPVYSGGGVSTYAPTISETKNGTVTVDPKAVASGAKMTITAKPDEGYEVDAVTVKDADGKDVPVTKNADGTYSFTMPEGQVTIDATFRDAHEPCARDETCPLNIFTDLDPSRWYHDGIEYCWENGLMVGVSGSRFSPKGTTSRGMIVSILYRLEGQPAVTAANPFSDVEPGRYYTNAVIWAAENEIVSGYGNGKFGPNDPITREQLAAILYRYAQSKGQGFTGTWSFKLDFPDAGDVSGWANEAVSWMVMNGIINGKDGKLVPKGDASRAEAATMLQRFCENVAK